MGTVFDTFVAYKFIKILVTPWKKTDAYKLGIIDDKGNNLKKRKDLKTGNERKAYTIVHTLIWNIKKLLDKLPMTKTKLGSFAVALWLLKEKTPKIKESVLVEMFAEYADIDIPEKKNVMESFLNGENLVEKGTYMVRNTLPDIYDFIDNKDTILVEKETSEGEMLGTHIFSGTHKKTGNRVVFSHEDLLRIS